jgi:GntR family transcriptional regulator, rspAB operon transcriptional repressor
MPGQGVLTERLSGAAPIGAQVYRLLRDRIVGMRLLPGERLSEAEIARALEVSRQPVREAFIKLSEDGLVEIRPQRGTYVRRISILAVEDARFVREAIEADITRLVAGDPDPALVAELRRQVEAQARLDASVPAEFMTLDERFHQTLAEAAGRPLAWSVIREVKLQMDRVRVLSVQRFPKRRLVEQHAAIVDGIAARDPARAEAAMRLHLREILNDLPAVGRANPGYFEAR